MTPVFPTIVAVLIGLSFEEFYADSAMPEESLGRLLLSLPLCLLPIVAGEIIFFFARRRFLSGHPFDARPYARWVGLLPLPLYGVVLFGFGWPKIVVPLHLEGAVLVDHLVVLLPYFLLLATALVQSLRMKRPFKLTPDGPRPARVGEIKLALGDAVRQLALVLVPLFGLIFALDLARDTPLRLYFNELPLLSTGFLVATLAVLALIYPALFRVGMGLKPLVAGAPLRRRLEAMAKDLGFRCRDILYWSTRRAVLNAAIVGVLPRFRYVILTDELCKRLTLDELSAVFAHEVGHGKRHHAAFYLLFSAAFLTALVPIGTVVGRALESLTDGQIEESLAAAVGVYLPAFAFYWLVLFGYLSRRFELEADVYGVESTRDPNLFITTLEKVARLGRIERRSRALRHFSIEGRTDFLRRAFVEGDTGLLLRFRRTIRLTRRGIAAAAAIVLACAAAWLGIDTLRGAGVILIEQQRPARAAELLADVLRVRPGDETARLLRSEALLAAHGVDSPESQELWQGILADAADLAPAVRSNLLDVLQAGWARALGRDDIPAARLVLDRAFTLNRVPERPLEPFDRGLEGTLREMGELLDAVQSEDVARLETVAEHPPRWLRRTAARAALAWLQDAASGPKGAP